MTPETQFSREELLARLTFEQFRVTQFSRTERPFGNDVHKAKGIGTYHCVVCDKALFSSDTKFNSGTGWPSFWEAIDEERVVDAPETDGDSVLQSRCSRCNAHLGHLFDDRKTPTNKRYCLNSVSLRFVPEAA